MEERYYQHLRLHERRQIYYLRHYKSLGIREIARRLDRHHSTISRELKRNSGCWCDQYYHNPAQRMADRRRLHRPRPPLLKTDATRKYVEEHLKLGWTPVLISGRLTHHETIAPVSHEAIYQFIYRERKDLITYLARKHKKRRKKYRTQSIQSKTSLKTMICDRPEHINKRTTFGHWESDSMESVNHEPGLNVILERKTRLVHITKLKGKTSKETEKAIISKLKKYDSMLCKSITFDNGVENWNFIDVENRLNIKSYFCDPYSSWQKGSVEQVIGLIRRYLPKKTDISKISDKELTKIERLLNSRPRRCLGFKTPYEMISEVKKNSGALEC
jgi:IS30 family transposase